MMIIPTLVRQHIHIETVPIYTNFEIEISNDNLKKASFITENKQYDIQHLQNMYRYLYMLFKDQNWRIKIYLIYFYDYE